MPAKRSTSRTPAKSKPAEAAPAPTDSRRSRSRRGASPAAPSPARGATKRKASPSPAPAKSTPAKKGRTESASPAPAKKQPSRVRAASTKKEATPPKPAAKSRAASKSEGSAKQSRVTRAVVEEVVTKKSTPARGRSASKQKALPTSQKKETPKRSATPKQKVTSAKKNTPVAKAAARGRSATPKSQKKAVSPKKKETPKQKPKSKPSPQKKTVATPKQKQTPVKQKTPAKAKSPAKSPAAEKKAPARRSRSRGGEKSEVTDDVEKDEADVKDDAEITKAEAEEDESVAPNENADSKAEESEDGKKEDGKEESAAVEPEPVEEAMEEDVAKEEAIEAEQATETEAEKDAQEKEDVEAKEVIPEVEENEPEKEVIEAEEDAIEKEAEESAESVKDEAPVQEDDNVEEDQQVSNQTEESNVISNDNVAMDTDADQAEDQEILAEDIIEPQNEADGLEHQAESEQIESDEKEECESAESEQVEADVTAPEVVELPESPKATSNSVEAIEVISDESSKDGADIVEISADIVEINEDSGDAVIIEDDIMEVGATAAIGGGDAQADPSDKTEDDDIQVISVAPVPVVEAVNDVSCTGVEVGQDAVQLIDGDKMVNSTVSNGATGESSSPRKRKWDETEDEISPKKARFMADTEQLENGSVSENNVSSDYVVIEMDQIPSADSQEVKDSLPKPVVQQAGAENPVYSRVFIPNPGFTSSGEGAKQFSVVSYNVLADCHLFRNDYSFTAEQFLSPEYRLTNLIKELEYLNGDVVCLQEVDPSFYSDTLLPKMQSLGYEGIHKKRTTDYYNEGEATFYKRSRFSLVDNSTPRLADLVEKELVDGVEPSIRDAVRRYLDLPDVLVVTKLRCINSGAEVTVGNIHVNWGEMKTPDAQCVQIASAIKEIVSRAGVDNLPHLICGDFNSEPLSPGYLVAKDGYPTGDETVSKLQEIKGLQLPDNQATSLVNSLWPAFQHTSSLRSAYNEVEGSEPQITSFNRVMKSTVDYVFYSHACLDNVGVLKTAARERILETGGIPNQYFPSDHVSLKVVLAFK